MADGERLPPEFGEALAEARRSVAAKPIDRDKISKMALDLLGPQMLAVVQIFSGIGPDSRTDKCDLSKLRRRGAPVRLPVR